MSRLLILPLLGVCVLLGLVLGAIPGLLLGIPGWHKIGAVLLALLWIYGYVWKRPESLGSIGLSTIIVAGGGGLGVGTSVWFFGSLTA